MAIELQYPLGTYSVNNPPSNQTLMGDLTTVQTAVNTNEDALTAHEADTSTHGVGVIVGTTEAQVLTNKHIALNSPRGFLLNGKIVPTDASGITLSLKTLAGTDPSVTDPVYIRIGDTIRSITSALSVVLADGTNWFNAGSAELATKEIDYFIYAVYDSNSATVALSFARIPYANLVSDFSATTTNEKYCAGYAGFTTTDEVENIGRFAATLSAGAGYTWTVPTFTAINLIQRPIFETRWLTFNSVLGGFSGSPSQLSQYQVIQNGKVSINFSCSGVSNATTFTGTMPFINGDASNLIIIPYRIGDNSTISVTPGSLQLDNNANTFSMRKDMAIGAWTASLTKIIYPSAPWTYKI